MQGLIFFREYQCIPTLNIGIMGASMGGVIVGICVLSMGKKAETEEAEEEEEAGAGADGSADGKARTSSANRALGAAITAPTSGSA